MLSKYLAVPDTQTVCQKAFNIPAIESHINTELVQHVQGMSTSKLVIIF